MQVAAGMSVTQAKVLINGKPTVQLRILFPLWWQKRKRRRHGERSTMMKSNRREATCMDCGEILEEMVF